MAKVDMLGRGELLSEVTTYSMCMIMHCSLSLPCLQLDLSFAVRALH